MLLHRVRPSLRLGLVRPLKEARALTRRVEKLARELLVSPGKILAPQSCALRLGLTHLARHVFIAGGSGNGKSKLIELMCRQIDSQRRTGTEPLGFTLIDPHGDTALAVLRSLADAGADPASVLYLEPGTGCTFSFDPFADAPMHASPQEYEEWLSATVDRIVRAILRNVSLAEQELMNRLRRWLKDVLTACGVALDEANTHVGLDKALVFTDPRRPEFGVLYDRVKDRLPEDVRSDFEKLIATQRARDQEAWLESTINRLRELLSPAVRMIFGQHATSIDLRSVIREGKVVLVNLAERDGLSRDQGNVIGGLLINLLLSTARRIPEALRVTHFLIVDEAENYVGEDLRMAFAELRKFKLVVVVIFQDLSCLKRGDLSFLSKVVSQCGLQMTYQQQNPDDVEFFAKGFGYGSLDFTPLLTDVVLPDGYDWVDTKSVSVGVTRGTATSRSVSSTQTHSETRQTHTAQSIQESVSLALSQTHSEGASQQWSQGESEQQGEGVSRSRGLTESSQSTRGTSRTEGEGESWSQSDGRSRTWGEGESRTVTEGESTQRGQGWSVQRGRNWSSQDTEGRLSQEGVTRSEQESQGTSSQKSSSNGTSAGESSGSSESAGSSRVTRSGGDGAVTDSANAGRSQSSSTTKTSGASESEGQTKNHSTGTSESRTDGRTESHSEGRGGSVTRGESDTFSRGRSHSVARGVNESRGGGVSHTDARGGSRSRGVGESETEGRGTSVSESQAVQTSAGRGTNRSHGIGVSASDSTGITRSISLGLGRTEGESRGISEGTSRGETVGTTASEGDSVSVSFQKTPLARHKILRDMPTGKLLVSVQDQLAKLMNILASLADRTLLVKCKGMGSPFLLSVHAVSPARADDGRVAAFLGQVRSAHACYFDPRAVARGARLSPPVPAEADAEEDNPIA